MCNNIVYREKWFRIYKCFMLDCQVKKHLGRRNMVGKKKRKKRRRLLNEFVVSPWRDDSWNNVLFEATDSTNNTHKQNGVQDSSTKNISFLTTHTNCRYTSCQCLRRNHLRSNSTSSVSCSHKDARQTDFASSDNLKVTK